MPRNGACLTGRRKESAGQLCGILRQIGPRLDHEPEAKETRQQPEQFRRPNAHPIRPRKRFVLVVVKHMACQPEPAQKEERQDHKHVPKPPHPYFCLTVGVLAHLQPVPEFGIAPDNHSKYGDGQTPYSPHARRELCCLCARLHVISWWMHAFPSCRNAIYAEIHGPMPADLKDAGRYLIAVPAGLDTLDRLQDGKKRRRLVGVTKWRNALLELRLQLQAEVGSDQQVPRPLFFAVVKIPSVEVRGEEEH